jgi:uncharacterized repeat protein (TIGR01451 family)
MWLNHVRRLVSGSPRKYSTARKAPVRRRTSHPSIECLEDRRVLSTLTVTTLADSPTFTAGDGTLRGEIAAAQKGDTILFSPSLAGGTINLTAGQLTINKNLTITGPATSDVIISGGSVSRVFDIEGGKTGGSVTLSNLAVENGVAGGSGGGLLINDVAGTVTLSNLLIANNAAFGAPGKNGAVAQAGTAGQGAQGGGLAFFGGAKATLVLSGDTVRDNGAQGGAGGHGGFGGIVGSGANGSGNGYGGAGGAGGGTLGGGAYVSGGTVQITGSTFQTNRAVGGDGGPGGDGGLTVSGKNGPGGYGGDGGTAQGGGLFVAGGSVQITDDTFQSNTALGGDGGVGGSGGNRGGPPGATGATGNGGNAQGSAVAVTGGSVQLSADRLKDNFGTGGANRSSSAGVHGGGNARGGGLYVSGGSVVLGSSAVFGNVANGGVATAAPGSGVGGGVAQYGGTLQLFDDTIAQNQVSGGFATSGASPGIAWGGGLALIQGSARLTNNTIAQNAALGSSGVGGGLIDIFSTAALANNIFAYNSASLAPDVDGSIGSSDHDLIYNPGGSTGWNNSDVLGLDPLLEALGNFGGPTETMPLAPTSPALNGGDNIAAPAATDQRGYARIVGGTIDSGACEYGATSATGDLAVTVTGAREVSPGFAFLITVTVTNHGTTAQSNVTLAGLLPANTDLVFWTTNASGWTLAAPASGATGTVSASIGFLAKGASATFTLGLGTNTNVPVGSVITTTFSVGPTAGDPKPANNHASLATAVIAVPTLVDSDLREQLGAIVYNATTHRYQQTVTLTNTSTGTLSGPISLVLVPIGNFTLANAAGLVDYYPYVSLVPKGKVWTPGQTLTLTLDFKAAGAADITYDFSVDEGV